MPDIQHLITTKQYYAAAWKVIDARPLMEAPDDATVAEVSRIAGAAITTNCVGELRRIMKAFEKWLDRPTCELAVTLLNETTDIDLQPDEL